MLVKCNVVRDGPGPSELIVGVKTRDGIEQLVISKRKLVYNQIDVGEPLATEGELFLVELPRETASGRWRVWVRRSEIGEPPSLMAAE